MHAFYESPLCSRYADAEMKRIFSDDRKFSTWRRLWLLLAESEQSLGVPITDEQLAQMRAHLDDIDYEKAAAYEQEVRHDVMEDIARRVPLSAIRRPAWDLERLRALGLECEAEEDVWRRVWSEEEKISFASTPLFLVRAGKP